jgi:hypothetical protein
MATIRTVRWTTLDQKITKNWSGRAVADSMKAEVPNTWWGVTQFVLDPRYFGIDEAKAFQPGKAVSVDLDAAYSPAYLPYLFHMGRYIVKGSHLLEPCVDEKRTWVDLPVPIAAAVQNGEIKTLEDLCRRLHEYSKTKFPADIYGPAILAAKGSPKLQSDKAHNIARLLFDFWENDDLRYQVIEQSGSFSWSTYYSTPWTLPARVDTTSIKRVIGIPALVVSVPAGIGDQSLKMAPAVNGVIRKHLEQLKAVVSCAYDVRKATEKEARLRHEYVAGLTALNKVMWASCQSQSVDASAATVFQKSTALRDKVVARLKEVPLGTLPDRADPLVAEPRLKASIASMFSGARDFKAETDRWTGVVVEKLTADNEFASAVKEWLVGVLNKTNTHSDNVRLWSEICEVLESAVELLVEAGGPNLGVFSSVAQLHLEALPKQMLDPKGLLRRATDTSNVLGAILSVLVNTGRTGLLAFGNFQSPLSLTVCLVRLVGNEMLIRAWRSSTGDRMRPLSDTAKWIFDRLGPLVPDENKPKYWEFKAALSGGDHEEASRLAYEIHASEQFLGIDKDQLGRLTMQSSRVMKGFLLAIQVASAAYAFAEFSDAAGAANEDQSAQKVAKAVLSAFACGDQGVQTVTFGLELARDMKFLTGKFATVAFDGANRWIGGIGATISALMFACDLVNSIRKGEGWEAIAYNSAGMGANAFLAYVILAGVATGDPLPLFIALAAVILVNIWNLVRTAPSATSTVAQKVFASTGANPIHAMLLGDPEAGPVLSDFNTTLGKADKLPMAPNTAAVVYELQEAGLAVAIIEELTGQRSLPSDLSLYRAAMGKNPLG